ncbi:hypothetical protein JM47_01615 [Ureaplasma diversum]|uniref:YneF family protein n=3 Tax=Ureaplasma diversum TaxID=42094 RepID=A0A0C5RMK6_9BACT|nr:hypothetical protein JM47_01615 [Ureaplasma diversum]
MTVGLSVGIVLFLIAGLIIGFLIAIKIYKRNLQKNPPITKDMIRDLYAQTGRKLPERRINEIYNNAIKPAKDK